jgi:hypothetical protein
MQRYSQVKRDTHMIPGSHYLRLVRIDDTQPETSVIHCCSRVGRCLLHTLDEGALNTPLVNVSVFL